MSSRRPRRWAMDATWSSSSTTRTAGSAAPASCATTATRWPGDIDRWTPTSFNGVGAGLTCGYEWGPAVGEGYRAPFGCNVVIEEASVETLGPMVRDPLVELAGILFQQ